MMGLSQALPSLQVHERSSWLTIKGTASIMINWKHVFFWLHLHFCYTDKELFLSQICTTEEIKKNLADI